MRVTLNVNGDERQIEADRDMPLLWAVRDLLNLTGTKYGCGAGLCGACTVMVDGAPQRACLLQIGDAEGLRIETIEAAPDSVMEALRAAWVELDVAQCGWCQSGQVMAAAALLRETPRPDDTAIEDAMDPQLCRCGTYARVRAGVHRAAAILAEGN